MVYRVPPFPSLPLWYLASHRHSLLDLGNSLSGVEALGACSCAVENGVASVQAHGVLKVNLSLTLALISRIGQPTVRLKEDSRTEIFLRIPPVRGARG